MTTTEQIADYLKTLKLKSAMMGYEKEEVLETLQHIDTMYQDAIETEKAKLQAIIDDQARQIADNDQQLQSMAENLGSYRKQSSCLEEKVNGLREQLVDATAVRMEYMQKRDALTAAILKWQKYEEMQREKSANDQEQLLISAKLEAADIIQRAKKEAAEQKDALLAETEQARRTREAAFWQITQLRDKLSSMITDETKKTLALNPRKGVMSE